MRLVTSSFAIALAASGIFPMHAAAQGITPEEAHDRIVNIIRSIATRPLPAGDTSVTWTRGPVLYHTTARRGGIVASSMTRNDHLMGIAETEWTDGRVSKFTVSWSTDGRPQLQLEGRLEDGRLLVSGSRDTSYAVPDGPWLVADYGFDEQLIPLLERLRADTAEQRFMAYRPYVGKWDSVRVVVRDTAGLRLAGLRGSGYTDWLAITPDGALLFVYRDNKTTERHPLETSRRYRDYLRLKFVVWPRD